MVPWSSLPRLAAAAALALLLPTCLVLDGLDGLSGSPEGDGGGVEGGGTEGGGSEGGEAGDAPPGPDARDAPGAEAGDGSGNGDVADVVPEVGSGDGEAGVLSYAATVLADSPLAYWRLDDTTTTTAKDFSGNGNDGTYQGNVMLGVQGAIANDSDKAVQFDGSSAEMIASVPGTFDFTGSAPYSVEVWVEPASSPGGMGIVGKSAYAADAGGYSGWYVAYNSGGYLDNWRNNDETGNPGPAPGAFIHVVATYDGATLALYVNGQPFSSYASSVVLASTGAPITAGVVADWGWFSGVLDEIAIYDKVLPAARIAAHYARGTGQ